jgi:hypothetical protein
MAILWENSPAREAAVRFRCLPDFLLRLPVLTPAHEYMMRPEQIMSTVFDAGILAGLIATRSRLPAWLFWTALLSGLGLFAIRFTSDHA